MRTQPSRPPVARRKLAQNHRLEKHENSRNVFANPIADPAWWQALFSAGVFFLAFYATFFSDFSQVAQRVLQSENLDLKADRSRLETEVSDLRTATTEARSAKAQLISDVQHLDAAKSQLLSDIKRMKKDMQTLHIQYLLAELPANLGAKRLPVLFRMDVEIVRRAEGRLPADKDFGAVAYDEAAEILDAFKADHPKGPYRDAITELQRRFYSNCPDKESLIARMELETILNQDATTFEERHKLMARMSDSAYRAQLSCFQEQ